MSVEVPYYRSGVLSGSTLVDDDVAAEINGCNLTYPAGYVLVNSVPLHRQIMGCVLRDGKIVHHVNEDPTDNRRANLLVVGSEKAHAALPHPWRQRMCVLTATEGDERALKIVARERAAAGLRPIGGYDAPEPFMPNLRAIREAAGKTQEHVAADLGISFRTVLRHEQGKTPLSKPLRIAYAAYYGVKAESIEQPEPARVSA